MIQSETRVASQDGWLCGYTQDSPSGHVVLQVCNIKEPRGLIRRNLWSFQSPQEQLSSRMDWELNKKACKEHHGPERERERGLDSP